MAKVLQFRRGTAAANSTITGAEGEIFVDLDTNTIRVHDGSTAGGIVIGDYDNLTNKPDLTQYDNVDFYADQSTFPVSGETYKIYVAEDTGYIYRWAGSGYSQIGGETPTWGSITGTLSSQTDLQSALDAKADSSSISAVGLSGDYNDLTNKPDLSVYDEVLPYANQAAFPATGATGKVYVAEDTGYIYRWSGSAYVQLTDQTAIWGQISGTLSNQSDLNTALSGKQATLVSGTNIKTVGGNSLLGSGDISVSADPTVTTSSANGNFKIPFANTTANTTGSYGLLQDSESTFTYNPSTNTLTAGTFSGSLSGTATSATNATNTNVTNNISTNATYYPTFVSGTSGNLGQTVSSTKLTFNPSNGNLAAGSLSGSGASITGLNASNISNGTIPGARGVTAGNASTSFVTYNGTNNGAGLFFGGSTYNPTSTTRLNYDGYFYATRFYGDGSQLTNLPGGANLSSVSQDVLPSVDGVYDLGSTTKEWFDVFVSNGVQFGSSVSLNLVNGYLSVNSDLVAQDIVGTSGLLGSVLISSNVVTPDKGGYAEGELIIDGNLDVQGEYLTVPTPTDKFLGAWSTGGNTSTARVNNAAAGTMLAGLVFGGTTSEEYNGTSWSSGGALSQRTGHSGSGTLTAALGAGGEGTGLGETLSSSIEYDGTSWTAGGNMPGVLKQHTGGGSQTAAFVCGGLADAVAAVATTYEYDGTSWSTGANLNVARYDVAGGGTQTAGIVFGGNTSTVGRIASTEEYNGSTWSTATSLAQVRADHGGASNNAAAEGNAISYGGNLDSFSTKSLLTEDYNGFAWQTGTNLPAARTASACTGNRDGFIAIGGTEASTSTIELTASTAIDSSIGKAGQIRFNQYTSKFEGFDGTQWVALH